MKKLRFKNRNGILYFGVDGKFKSSKIKYSVVNKNILMSRFLKGDLESPLSDRSNENLFLNNLVCKVIREKEKHLKHKSILAYRSSYDNHILPYFDGVLTTEVKPITVKKFQDSLVEKGLKKSSIQLCRILLKEAFELSVLSEDITMNPISSVSMPKIRTTKKKPIPLSLDEIDLVLDYAHGQFKNFLGISFFTGMRSGELLALKWDDVDLTIDTISITKTIAQGTINSAKTRSSERDIEIISNAKKFFIQQRLLTGLKNSYVFLNAKASHFSSNDNFYRNFQSVLKSVGIEKRALHNTRHTFASLMLNNGIDKLWVSHTLGHENLQITLSIYTHFMPKKEKMSLPFLEKRYKNGTL